MPAYAPDSAYGGQDYVPGSAEALCRLEENSFWFRERNRLLEDAFGRFFPQGGRFLEVGCGTGYVLSGLASACPGLSPVGAELFLAGLKLAASRLPRTELIQMDARRIPFVEEFDVIGAFDCLEHIGEEELALKQMHQALKKGGGLILTVPQHPCLWSAQDELSRHKRRYTRRGLTAKLKRAGFQVQWSTSFVSLLLPFFLFSRVLVRYSKTGGSVLNMPRPLDLTLGAVADIERRLIKKGLRFPVGGSLLMVGRKEPGGWS
ncbi:MAG: class I SAM-dependent methyltransferase [Deltaproteobacteria bacterium]|nr:class I SAM-dependent methyltransferase [Deltaproteobacteria bacterium]